MATYGLPGRASHTGARRSQLANGLKRTRPKRGTEDSYWYSNKYDLPGISATVVHPPNGICEVCIWSQDGGYPSADREVRCGMPTALMAASGACSVKTANNSLATATDRMARWARHHGARTTKASANVETAKRLPRGWKAELASRLTPSASCEGYYDGTKP
jgi:hypothetical protein